MSEREVGNDVIMYVRRDGAIWREVEVISFSTSWPPPPERVIAIRDAEDRECPLSVYFVAPNRYRE